MRRYTVGKVSADRFNYRRNGGMLICILLVAAVAYAFINSSSESSHQNFTEEITAPDSTNIHGVDTSGNQTRIAKQEDLERQIRDILDSRIETYAVFVYGFDSEVEVGINADKLYFPGSIYKVPTAVLVLSDVEDGKYDIDTELELTEDAKQYPADPLYYYEEGSLVSIEDLLQFSLRFSDNTAWDMLMDNMGEVEVIDQRFIDELGLTHTSRTPFQTTAREVGRIFRGLYNNTLITEENSERILDLLSHVSVNQNDRIVAGVPQGTRVAHKVGNWNDVWQDAGIVYGNSEQYVLVVLNRNTSIHDAQQTIQAISKCVWDFFSSEVDRSM